LFRLSSEQQADEIDEAYVASINAIRQRTPQIPESTILPEPEWLREQGAAFAVRAARYQRAKEMLLASHIPGVYEFEIGDGPQTSSGRCTFAEEVQYKFRVACQRSGGHLLTTGVTINGDALNVNWWLTDNGSL